MLTVAPRPAPDSITTSPPRRATISRMALRPSRPCMTPSQQAGSKPRPLSETVRRAWCQEPGNGHGQQGKEDGVEQGHEERRIEDEVTEEEPEDPGGRGEADEREEKE
jgi:hypothetical protein